SVTEGTVTQWLKNVGDTVEVDEPLLEVSTDKVDTEIPSPVARALTKILVDEDETVDIGAEIALIGAEGEEEGDTDDSSAQSEPATEPATEPEHATEPSAESEPEPAAPSSPSRESSGPATSVSMPDLGERDPVCSATRRFSDVGDTVEVDEPLLEVS